MKILISGNNKFGLSASIGKLFPNQVTFMSRSSGYDLTNSEDQKKFANLAIAYDVIIISAALWKFNQTVLLDIVAKTCSENGHTPHIICIGSTTDRVKKGGAWLYNAEKKALRDYCNTHGMNGVWGSKSPKITLISFGTLSNNQEKHPDRKCLNIDEAAEYVKWIIDQPKHVGVNEISIDPMQGARWYD